MSKRRKRKNRTKNRDVLNIDKDIKLYEKRHIELCSQFDSSTQPHMQCTLKLQLDNISSTINELLKQREQLITQL